MDKIDEMVIDVALAYNGRKDFYAGRNITKEMQTIEKGEQKLVEANEKLARSQQKVAASGFKLGSALRTLGLYIGLKEVVKYADEWQNISNILKQVTSTEKERIALQEKLYQIGKRTRTTTASSAELYTNLGSLGLSEQQQLNATEILQKAFKSTGSNQRSVESIRRMLRTGKLSSLLGVNQRLAEIIASGMNMSLAELQTRIRKGGLTSMQVLTAISNKSKDIDENFSKTKTTLSEAFDGIKESSMKFIGNLEDSTGVFDKTAKLIGHLADNLKALGIILGIYFLGKLEKSVGILDLFFLNMKDGMGILGSAKGVFNALLAPWAKMLLLFELISQAMKMIKGEWNWYSAFIDKIERGTWWLMNKATGQNKAFRGTFSSDVQPVSPAKTVTNTGGTNQNITQNQTFDITINEAKDGQQAYIRIEDMIRRANSGMGGGRPRPAWMKG